MNSPYASDKAARFPLHLAELRAGRQPYPVHVQLVPMDRCNQNSHFCAYRSEGYTSNQRFGLPMADGTVDRNPNRSIPWEKLQEIVSDCKKMGVRAIQLTGGGEPTLHPHFDDLCQMIVENGMELAVVTNGLLLKPQRAKWLAQNATWVRVSVDAGCAETYSRLRRVPAMEYGIVAANVAQMCATRGRSATIGVGFVVTENNHREILRAAHAARGWGADNVRISAYFQNEGSAYYSSRGILDQIARGCDQVKYLSREGFRVFDNFSSRFSDLDKGSPDYEQCGYMNFTTYIGGDQNVYTCCVNAYNDRGLVGSVKDQSFRTLWGSIGKLKMFGSFDARGCERCMFNDKNQAIAELVAEPTSHDCFV